MIFNKINSWLHDNIESKNPKDQQNNNKRLPRGTLPSFFPISCLPATLHTTWASVLAPASGWQSLAHTTPTSESHSCRLTSILNFVAVPTAHPFVGGSVRFSVSLSGLVYSVQKSFGQVDKSSFGTWVTRVGPAIRALRLMCQDLRLPAFGIGSAHFVGCCLGFWGIWRIWSLNSKYGVCCFVT